MKSFVGRITVVITVAPVSCHS